MSKQAVITQKLKSHLMRNRKVTIQINAHIQCKTVTLPITQRLYSFYIVLTKDKTTSKAAHPGKIGAFPGAVMYWIAPAVRHACRYNSLLTDTTSNVNRKFKINDIQYLGAH